MRMKEVVRAEALTKLYGMSRGILDLDFTVEAGEVFGFLGPNGAGKTTTIRLMLDLIRPTNGRLSVFGLDSRRDSVEIRRRIGYLPGDLRLYERLTPRELLRYFAHLRGLPSITRGELLAERLELDLDRRIKELSRGNRQKVGLIQAFMHEPDLLVLDEPTNGLDPLVQEIVLRAGWRGDGGRGHRVPLLPRFCPKFSTWRSGWPSSVTDGSSWSRP